MSARLLLLLCFLSGLAGGLIFHHNWLGLLGWFALVPYFVAIRHMRGKLLFIGTMLFGCTWYYLGLWWLHTLVVFSWLVPLGVVAGVTYISLYFLLFAYPAAWCARNVRPWLQPWIMAACWTATEFLRGYTDMAFPWNLLGHSQVPFNWYHTGTVSLSGISLVSFSMALVNASIASLWGQRSHGCPMWRCAYGVLPGLAFVALIPALARALQPAASSGETIRVSVIQPGISQVVRWDAMMGLPNQTDEEWMRAYQETEARMEERIDMLVRQAGTDHPDMIVLPESPFLVDRFPYQTLLHSGLTSLAQETSASIFLGADYFLTRSDYDRTAALGQQFLRATDQPLSAPLPQAKTRLNDRGTTELLPDLEPTVSLVSAYLVTPRGVEPYVYNKMQLVPFGENIPFIGNMDWLLNALDAGGIAGRYRPGMQNTVFTLKDKHRFGAVICFESTFPYLARRLHQAGAKFICVLTNDSWYDPAYAMEQGGFWGSLFKVPGLHQLAGAGPAQHYIHSQLRALETGLPIVRSANTGVSAVIGGDGKSAEVLTYGESGWLTGDMQVDTDAKSAGTLFVRAGDWISLICMGTWLSLVATIAGSRWLLRRRVRS